MNDQENTKIDTIYTRASKDKAASKTPILVGSRISPEWLSGSVPVIEVRISGGLLAAVSDLMEAAKKAGRDTTNLPISSLRLALTASIRNIISIHRDLGVGVTFPAMQMFVPADDDRDQLRASISTKFRQWSMDVLEQWAEHHGMGEIAARVKSNCMPENISLLDSIAPFQGKEAPDFALIARCIGEKLIGDELFLGMGPCEIVATPDSRSGSIELMTMPSLMAKGERSFSMVARLTVCTVPYSPDVYIGVTCMKRVWATRVPGVNMRMPSRVSGYVVSPGRPAVQVPIVRKDGQWSFDESGYVLMQRESSLSLPETLEQAVSQRLVGNSGWWAGLPELPTLFRYIAPHTVFESDEVDLLKTIRPKLGFILSDADIPLREVSLVRFQAKLKQEMLRITDLEQDWIAGASLVIEGEEDDEDEGAEDAGQEESGAERQAKIASYRAQNIAALKACGAMAPRTLWMLGGNPGERDIVIKAVNRLFGDEITVRAEPLPNEVHDLKANLPGKELVSRKRFDLRLDKWGSTAKAIQTVAEGEPVLALVCAPDHYGHSPEDPVNYYAGIHALCRAGANVHYLLPQDGAGSEEAQQSFLHRTQSALLDVILAHNGVFIGIRDFLERALTDTPIPKAIYGIQAVRSRARSFSGEVNVNFILYTRLIVETGITEILIVHCQSGKTRRTPWMPLSKGLRWVGCERSLCDGSEAWLSSNFEDETRDILSQIATGDPNAFVLIDWQSVAGLWKGIRDEDLKKGVPRLNETPLSRFAPLTFVRLRRGENTMALRIDKRVAYDGWDVRDGQRHQTGEVRVDEYYTTSKTLVEVAAHDRSGHFVCTMGYPKQVQVKRGLSSYRNMRRLKKAQQGYVEISLDPGNIDAALPAPMDITVMQARNGVLPEQVAMVVMGLRFGYAHYNDWTTLPAPLFFRRKIEDYIIRYPEDAENIAVVPEAPPEAAVTPMVTHQMELRLSDLEDQPQEAAHPKAVKHVFPVGVNISKDDEELLSRAKSIVPVAIYRMSGRQVETLCKAMIQNQPGNVQVHVPLPYFVNVNDLFDNPANKNLVRRYSGKIWNRLRDFGYVPLHGQTKPGDSNFALFLSQKMLVPQAFQGLINACHGLFDYKFKPMDEILERDYNPIVPEDERIHEVRVDSENIPRLVRRVVEQGHDALLAWIIFSLAQNPEVASGHLQEIWSEINSVPGPMTRDALDYYIQSAAAIEAALAQKDNLSGFRRVFAQRIAPPAKPIVTDLSETKPPLSKMTTEIVKAFSLEASDAAITLIPKQARKDAQPSVVKPSIEQQGSPFMELKNQLLQLLGGLELGSQDFEQQMRQIQRLLASAGEMNQKELERRATENAVEKELVALAERGKIVVEDIAAIHADIQMNRISYRAPAPDEIAQVRDQMASIETKLIEFRDQLAIMASLQPPGAGSSLQERRRYTEISNNALEAIDRIAAELQEMVAQSPCFAFENDGTDPDPGKGSPAEVAENNVQTPADLPAAEPSVDPTTAALVEEVVQQAETEAASESQAIEDAVSTTIAQAEAVLSTQQAVNLVGEREGASATAAVSDTTAEAVQEAPAAADAASRESEKIHESRPAPAVEEQDVDLLEDDIGDHVEVLRKLMKRRYFGLADVQAEALKYVIEEEHGLILKALVKSLDAMVCQFEFETKLDPDLEAYLNTEGLKKSPHCAPEFVALGVLGAGFSSLLFDAYDDLWSVMGAISLRLTGQEAVAGLLEHVNTIHQHGLGLVLTREKFLISKIGEKESLQVEMARMRESAKNWKYSTEIYSNWNHRGYMRMHEELFSSRTAIGLCLQQIAAEEHDKLGRTWEEARRLFDKPAAAIEEVWKRNKERTRIEGLYAHLAIKNLEITEKFIGRYLLLLAASKDPSKNSGQLPRNEQHALDELHEHLRAALNEIQGMEPATPLERLYQEAAADAIEASLRLYEPQSTQVCFPQHKQKLLIQLPMGANLMPCLQKVDDKTPALCTPQDVFGETKDWADTAFTFEESPDSIDKHLREAIDTHAKQKRFLPVFRIAYEVGTKAQQDSLMTDYSRAKAEFITDLQEASQRVAHALTLSSSLGQEEASKMQQIIDMMLTSLRQEYSIGHPKGDLVMYPDFQYAITALSYNVLRPLDNILKDAATRLNAELDSLSDQFSRDDIRRVRDILKGNNPASLRTAYDAMSMLKEYQKLPDHIGEPVDFASQYENFIREYHQFARSDKVPLESLCERLKQPPQADDPAWLAVLDTDGRQEALGLIQAWLDLHSKRNVRTDCADLNRVLTMMGVSNPEGYSQHETGRNNRAKFSLENNRAFYFPTGLGEDVFIPPKLGSEARHIQGFVMYGKPSDNELIQVANEVGPTPTLILTRSHFPMAKRAAICGQYPVMLIDDDLLAYIALHPAERLQAMLRVVVLTFSNNPYADYGVRPVPPEMFFGRQKELASLRNVKSMAILFGGRRLGKSSLFNQVVEETQAPELAIMMSLLNCDTTDYVNSAWRAIYTQLLQHKVISEMPARQQNDGKAIKEWIENELIRNDKQLRSLYLLLDEADDLMARDLECDNDKRLVKDLSNLIENVQGHGYKLRIAIAGLHNMGRMSNEKNSVYGKIEPIALEPFTTPEDMQRGLRLITKPMAAMGFLFEQERQDLPMRIMSVCNYYPAFIQLYCEKLVEHMQNKRNKGRLPAFITPEDLDAVERNQTMLAELRKKFELNLDLDTRYRAIALVLAEIYYSSVAQGELYEGLNLQDIRSYCETLAPAHFHETGSGTYEALLDEMCKLKILKRHGSRYMLRNPDISRMMGDRAQVSAKIDDLATDKPTNERTYGDRYILMEAGPKHKYFPMPVGWIRSNLQRDGDGTLMVLTGNNLSGLLELNEESRDTWMLGQEWVTREMLGTAPNHLNEMIQKERVSRNRLPQVQLVTVRPGAWKVSEVGEYAAIAEKAASLGIRVALISPPERTLELATAWMRNALPGFNYGTGSKWAPVIVPPWSEDSVHFFMHENTSVSRNSDALRSILKATCGFGVEVRAFCDKNLTLESALAAPDTVWPKLGGTLESFYKRLGVPPAFTQERRNNMHALLTLINGEQRNPDLMAEICQEINVPQHDFTFMYFIGLLQDGPNNTWFVPDLYMHLIEKERGQ